MRVKYDTCAYTYTLTAGKEVHETVGTFRQYSITRKKRDLEEASRNDATRIDQHQFSEYWL